MFKRRSADPVKAAESEVARLRQRRDDLAARLRAATAEADTAVQAQRAALVADDLDGPTVQRAEADCQTAVFRRDSLADALDETARLLADAEAQLAADRDRIEREQAALDLIARADAIEAAAACLPAAVAAVASLHGALMSAIREQGLRSPVFPGLDRPPETVALTVLIEALGAALPVAAVARHPQAPPARDVTQVVHELMTARMRSLAEAIRAGTADIAESLPIPPAAAPVTIQISERRVTLKEAIEWAGLDGTTVRVMEGTADLPEPVAEEALARGIGFPIDSPDGAAVLREAAEPEIAPGARNFRPTRIRRGPPWTRLNVNLFAFVEAERDRLRRVA
jgi:hypothetical protein